MTATIVKASGEHIVTKPKNETDFSLEEAQAVVGGYIEVVPLSSTQIMVCNEEGLLINLPINPYASIIARMAGRASVIVGDVLICETSQLR